MKKIDFKLKMETENHSNGAELKSPTSRGNLINVS